MISLSSGDSSWHGVSGQQRDITSLLTWTEAGHRLPAIQEQQDHRGVPLGDHGQVAERVLG